MTEPDIVTTVPHEDDVGKSICMLCLKNAVKYTCPRCNIGYCCVDCYKSPKHSSCSEEFYKQCFLEGLKESEADPEDKQRVLEMLKRAENDPDLNDLDQPDDDLEERLNDLDLDKDTDKIWSRLTEQEKKEFEAMAGDGRLGTLVELWTPWWQTASPLVEEIDNQSPNVKENQSRKAEQIENQAKVENGVNHSDESKEVKRQSEKNKEKKKSNKAKVVSKTEKSKLVKQSKSAVLSESDSVSAYKQPEEPPELTDESSNISGKPQIKTDIPNISDILHTKPSADVKYNVVNVLYSYIFVCRLHNGEHISMATESAEDFLEISDVMSRGGNFGTTREAIQACLLRIQSKSSFQTSQEYNITIITDLVNLISFCDSSNPINAVLLALSDIYLILKTAYRTCSRSLKSSDKSKSNKSESVNEKLKTDKSRLFKGMKKCEFLLSWTQSYGLILIEMVPELELENSFLSSELEAMHLSKQQLETEWGGKTKPKKKTLIEQI